jgi:hypothetical protein
MSEAASVTLGDLGLDEGATVLLARALSALRPGERVRVRGTHPALAAHLRGWCRARGDALVAEGDRVFVLEVGEAERARWSGAGRAGAADPSREGALAPRAPGHWGLAARGARVEEGAPAFHFALDARAVVWADEAPRLYAQAAAAQWDPATAIPWDAALTHDDAVEDAVVQVMTYLVENEAAALLVPARFLAQVHPHYREVMQLLAVQCADEARHIEVFTRRMLLRRDAPGTSRGGGQASLKTLVDEGDFAEASFLLSVLGEGSFLSLLWFLHAHGPDAATRAVALRSAQDEARHVAFGLAHLASHAAADPSLRDRLALAVQRRHASLQHTAGLNEDVYDALVLVAAGSLAPDDLRAGAARVRALQHDMDLGRQQRLRRLGYTDAQAVALSSLHTRNFM